MLVVWTAWLRAAQPRRWQAGRQPARRHSPIQVRFAFARDRRRAALPHRPVPPRASQRAQPRRRLADPHPSLPRTALRRLPHRRPDALHPGRAQTRRHGARHLLRHRRHRARHPATRQTVHREPGQELADHVVFALALAKSTQGICRSAAKARTALVNASVSARVRGWLER